MSMPILQLGASRLLVDLKLTAKSNEVNKRLAPM